MPSKVITPGCKVRCIRGSDPVLTVGKEYTVGAVLGWVHLGLTPHKLTINSSEQEGGTLSGIGGWFKPTTDRAFCVQFDKPQVILINSDTSQLWLWDADRFEVVE